MSEHDISGILSSWPFEKGRVNARRIEGADGRPKLQIRVDLGVLQLEMEGRPDGQRPGGFESLLDQHTDELRGHIDEQGSDSGFTISGEVCRTLREEAVQYYHRYVGLFVLTDYEGVIRDTERNLRCFDFCRAYAEGEDDRVILEQFRPHVLMMRTRAVAELALAAGRASDALAAIDHGLQQIKTVYDDAGVSAQFDDANEVQLLRGMRDTLVPKLPASQRAELEERLASALAAENYELAAILRDELRMLE